MLQGIRIIMNNLKNNIADVKEYYIGVDDGVSLKIIDIIPGIEKKNNPIIMFISGWISIISGWKDVLSYITYEYRIIYIETREKTSSKLPQNKKITFNMKRLVMDINQIIDKLLPKNRDFILIGSSLGATIILEYLLQNIRNPKCAVLISPNTEFRFPKILGDFIPLFPASLYFVVKPIIKWYLKNFRLDKKNEREQVLRYEKTLNLADPYKLKANAIAIKKYKILHNLSNISIPCLIIGGTADKLHKTSNLLFIANLLSNAEFVELKNNKESHSERAGELIVEYIKKININVYPKSLLI